MLRNQISVGIYTHLLNAEITPSKPQFSMEKTKAKLAEYFNQNKVIRELCDKNKKQYPRMHQSVQATGLQLVMYYIKNWGKGNARNYELRITHGYLKKAFNDSCCIATIKNHINKLMRMYKGFITEKYRGGLGLEKKNTPCIVLVLDPKVLRFVDERHNQAVEEGKLSAEESKRKMAETIQREQNAARGILNTQERIQAEAEKRLETPSSFGQIFNNIFGPLPKQE